MSAYCQPVSVVLPMMKAAAHRAIALVFGAKRVKTVRTNVLKSTQIFAEPLHEYRATTKNRAKPVAVIGDIGRYAKQRPYFAESCLLMFKRSGINEGARPSRVVSNHLSRHRLSSYEM